MVARIKLNGAPEARVYLAEWRETKYATQQDLADAIGTSVATVSRIETGKREWSKGYLEALAYLVDCRVGDLFQPPDTIHSKPNLQELMNLAGSLSDDQIRSLISLLGRSTTSAPPESPALEGAPARRAKAKPA